MRSPSFLLAALVAACVAVPGCAPGSVSPDAPAPEPAAAAAVETDTCPARLPAPDTLPGVRPEHTELGYWLELLARDVDLDAPLMTPAEVRASNLSRAASGNAAMRPWVLDEALDEEAILRELDERLAYVRERLVSGEYVLTEGSRATAEQLQALTLPRDLALSGELRTATALVDVRCAPIAGSFYTPALDRRFDRNLCVTLRPGDALRVIDRQPDQWLVRTRHTLGWIDADAAVSSPLEALPPSDDAPAPLTRRAVLERAFAMLGTPYGWGGSGGGVDCSGFLIDVLSPFGIELPRYSGLQAESGEYAIDVSEITSPTARMGVIDAAHAQGVVLLHFPGHIMLYLGRDDGGTPMAIHAFAEYLAPCDEPEPGGDVETLFEVDRVTVSDLELGRGSSRRAFIERVTRVTVLGPPPDAALRGIATRRPPAPIDAAELATCETASDVRFLVTPRVANARQPLRVVATSSRDLGSVEVVFVSPDGAVTRPEIRRLSGPPDTVVAAVDAPEPGRWKVAVGESGRVVACDEVRVASSPPARERTTDAVWSVRNRWDEGFENLYAAFVESLFDYPVDEDLTWRSLHELTRDPQRNLLHDYYGGGEDEEFVLEPDCADLPYMLRAYFSWKMGLPFGFRQCSRGRAGQPPRCGNLRTNQEARSGGDDIDAFARFARRDVRSGVHSASGRTHPDDDDTDYYPVALTREALRPGTLYADPYGHLLVIARWVPQGAHGPGVLIGADAQPDGTVGRRRFWRGSFLFSPRTEDAGAGFKAFRPLVARGDALVSLGNDDLRDDVRFAPFSLEQYEGSTDDFYARMEALINPRSLDPETELLGLVDALEEAVARRVNSVDNGEVFMAERDFAPIEMPSGYAIFETSGAWENYSTPSRDMRMLISIDTVRMHPERVRATPARYGLPAEGAALDAAVAALEALLADELAERSFQYTRSDGSTWRLTLAELVDRAADLEVAYNPNDCMELRWGADLASEEGATCDRRAPSAQTARMAEYRNWFATRTRPPR